MTLVSDWKDAWKWFSVHIAVVMAALNTAMATVAQLQAFIPPDKLAYINAALGVAVIFARVVQQGPQE
jgi:hypothetical protein